MGIKKKSEGQTEESSFLNNCDAPNLAAHHQDSRVWRPAIWMLVVRYYCSYYGALFFFVENYLCVYLVTALCSVFAE